MWRRHKQSLPSSWVFFCASNGCAHKISAKESKSDGGRKSQPLEKLWQGGELKKRKSAENCPSTDAATPFSNKSYTPGGSLTLLNDNADKAAKGAFLLRTRFLGNRGETKVFGPR